MGKNKSSTWAEECMSQQAGTRKGKVVLGEALQWSLRSSLDWRWLYICVCVYIFISNGFFFHPVRLWRSNDGKTWYLVKWEGFLAKQLWVRSWCLCLAWFYFSTLKQLSTRWEDTLWLRYRLTPGMAWSLDGICWGLFWMSSVKTILGYLSSAFIFFITLFTGQTLNVSHVLMKGL